MTKVEALIENLAGEAGPAAVLPGPRHWVGRMLFVLSFYGFAVQIFLGLRLDLGVQLMRPFYLAEVILLLLIIISGTVAAIHTLYPDCYQRGFTLKLPFGFLGLLILLFSAQAFLPYGETAIIPPFIKNGMECTLCIASAVILPSTAMFVVLNKGASVQPLLAGWLAVLVAGGIGALTLRFAEANDNLHHLILWHYLPTLLFAALGAALGRIFLKW